MADKELEILCIGNALMDVFAHAESGKDYGLKRPVQHIKMEKLSGILSALNTACPPKNVSPLIICSGGGAANVAKIAGFLGAKVSFSGAIGAGDFGRSFTENLNSAGVELNLAKKPLPTGICLMLRSGGKTLIAACPSAARKLSKADISERDIERARIVVIDGFMLDRPGLVRHVLTLAEKHGTAAALDLSSVSIAAEYAAKIAGYARRFPIILFMNKAEASAFHKSLGGGENKNEKIGLRQISSFLKSQTKGKDFPLIVVKLGSGGALCFSGGKESRVKTQVKIPRETTGSGDAFCAAFLTAWVRGMALRECCALGNEAAGIILAATGTQPGKSGQKRLARLIKKNSGH